MKIPQELVVVIFVGGVIVFFLFVILSSLERKRLKTRMGKRISNAGIYRFLN